MTLRLSLVLALAGTLLLGNAAPRNTPGTLNGLNITVLAGEDGANIVKSGDFAETIVEVRDANSTPVGVGASVTFGAVWDSSDRGNSVPGTFPGGSSTLTVTTDHNGRATLSGFEPRGSGRIQITVEASYGGESATCVIRQTNYTTVAAARKAGWNPDSRQASRVIAAPEMARGAEDSLDLEPFSHVARVPAGTDLASLRFRRVKAVTVPTEIVSTMTPGYCEDVALRAEGSSMFCPEIGHAGLTKAYEVTYSFEGEPLGSDEYGGRYFSFSVYFRPEELSPALRAAVFGKGKPARADVERLFAIATTRESRPQVVIDDANSSLCGGNYNMDGLWLHSDRTCEDKVAYKTIEVPSGYLTLKLGIARP